MDDSNMGCSSNVNRSVSDVVASSLRASPTNTIASGLHILFDDDRLLYRGGQRLSSHDLVCQAVRE